MILAFVAFALLGAVVAMPTYGVPPVQAPPAYPSQPAPVVQTYPVYLPPQYNDAPVSNVRPGRDYGAFLDVFDGPHMHYGRFPMIYYPYPGYGYGYGGPISNPFYSPRPRRRHHRRHSREGCNSREEC
ncbi:spore coat protein T domain protein [Ancylostoma caninum]|uniref:Spore coat protein T domain protein n=1 Tax=Ancylostoma caninum TaxID=29170 RepID=A0A368GRA9_ANCCA|nr:spore coat protein T domain protein [Ancylostoma caninum]